MRTPPREGKRTKTVEEDEFCLSIHRLASYVYIVNRGQSKKKSFFDLGVQHVQHVQHVSNITF